MQARPARRRGVHGYWIRVQPLRVARLERRGARRRARSSFVSHPRSPPMLPGRPPRSGPVPRNARRRRAITAAGLDNTSSPMTQAPRVASSPLRALGVRLVTPMGRSRSTASSPRDHGRGRPAFPRAATVDRRPRSPRRRGVAHELLDRGRDPRRPPPARRGATERDARVRVGWRCPLRLIEEASIPGARATRLRPGPRSFARSREGSHRAVREGFCRVRGRGMQMPPKTYLESYPTVISGRCRPRGRGSRSSMGHLLPAQPRGRPTV